MLDKQIMINNIIDLCEEKEISRCELAKRVGVSPAYYSHYLTEKSRDPFGMSVRIAYKTAKELGVSVDELLTKDLAIQSRIRRLERELSELRKTEVELNEQIISLKEGNKGESDK